MPLLVAFLLLQHDGEGSPILFDATGRGIPLLVALLPLEHDREGTSPPRRVLVFFLTRQGGECPSSSRSYHFNTTGRAGALPIRVFVSFLTRRGGVCPPRRVLAT